MSGHFLGQARAMIGMVHVPALPGTPFARLSLDDIVRHAAEEARTLAECGFDAVLIENMHDRPYVHGAKGPETVAAMSVNQMGECRVCAVKTAMPALSNDAEFFPGMPKTWGLSFMINTERAPTGRSPGSLAWAGLANTYFWIDPAAGVGGVYATQVLPFADKKALPLFFAFEKAVYDQLG